MGDLAALCAVLGADPAAVTVGRYRGPGERTDRKTWRQASVPVRDYRGLEILTGAGRDNDEATLSLATQLRARVRGRADRLRRRASEHRRSASECRRRAQEHDTEAIRDDADAERLEEVCRG